MLFCNHISLTWIIRAIINIQRIWMYFQAVFWGRRFDVNSLTDLGPDSAYLQAASGSSSVQIPFHHPTVNMAQRHTLLMFGFKLSSACPLMGRHVAFLSWCKKKKKAMANNARTFPRAHLHGNVILYCLFVVWTVGSNKLVSKLKESTFKVKPKKKKKAKLHFSSIILWK